jgi:hypothetical protein
MIGIIMGAFNSFRSVLVPATLQTKSQVILRRGARRRSERKNQRQDDDRTTLHGGHPFSARAFPHTSKDHGATSSALSSTLARGGQSTRMIALVFMRTGAYTLVVLVPRFSLRTLVAAYMESAVAALSEIGLFAGLGMYIDGSGKNLRLNAYAEGQRKEYGPQADGDGFAID